jgi:hypothetical protein
MGVLLTVLVLGLGGLAIVWTTAGGWFGIAARVQQGPCDETSVPFTQALRYRVPAEQDPDVVLDVLAPHGYLAEFENDAGALVLVIYCPRCTWRDRDEVRELLASAHVLQRPGPEVCVRDVPGPGERVLEPADLGLVERGLEAPASGY